MKSQTQSSKRAPRELQNWRVQPVGSKWRFAALRFVHSQDIREIRGPNAFKTRLKCTCHQSALSVTRQTCTWNCRVQGNPPTLRQPFANPSPTFRQPFANLFCQPLSKPLFLWTPGTGLETRVNVFLVVPLKGKLSCRHRVLVKAKSEASIEQS